MLQVRVVFDLVHARDDLGGRERGFEVRLQVVGYADAARFAGCVDGFHGCPGGLEVAGGGEGEGGVN